MESTDEVSRRKSSPWTAATSKMSNFLNKECREPKTVILQKHAVSKITENLPEQNISQGRLCLLVDFSQEHSLSFVAKLLHPDFELASGGLKPFRVGQLEIGNNSETSRLYTLVHG